MAWTVTGGQVVRDGAPEAGDLLTVDGVFTESAAPGARRFDAAGLILAPGIIDVHGDGFERNLSPRPGVYFDLDTALIETDRQLVANGITTAYLAMTIAWDPGLRSLDMARALVAALDRVRPRLLADLRLQLRWEVFALDAVDQVEEWLGLSPRPTLAFNDHFSALTGARRTGKKLIDYTQRSGLDDAGYLDLIDRVRARADEVPGAIRRLTGAAVEAGITCYAHDEKDAGERRANRASGITVCEFPMTRPTAEEAVGAGEPVILGAPNVLRGGSHIGAIDAAPAIAEGLCTVLASDYYYPAQFRALARLGAGTGAGMARHWDLVAGRAAEAVGDARIGTLAPGARADIAAFRETPGGPAIEAVFRRGQPVFVADPARIG